MPGTRGSAQHAAALAGEGTADLGEDPRLGGRDVRRGQRAHRTAFAALKHSFEKVGDHWEPKGRKGPSDPQAAGGGPARRAPTAGGVDANAPKEHLLEVPRSSTCPGAPG